MKVSRVVMHNLGARLTTILVLILLLSLFGRLATNVNVGPVSAAPTSPYIAIVPEQTADPSFTVGSIYTISLYTNYAGSDIYLWQFSLAYDPYVLQLNFHNKTDTWIGDGSTRNFYTSTTPIVANSQMVYVDDVLQTINVNYTFTAESGRIAFRAPSTPKTGTEVKVDYTYGIVNGGLISSETGIIFWASEEFNNTSGESGLTTAGFAMTSVVTSGPGTLAYVNFTVVGTGYSDITLGDDTQLVGYNASAPENPYYKIIDAATMPSQIGHGYFDNIPNVHDLAVSKLVAPATAVWGNQIPINVTVRSEGNFTDSFSVTVYVNTTFLGTQAADLTRGAWTTLTFSWNTTNEVVGNYLINTTVSSAEDIDLSDNSKVKQIQLKMNHISIIDLEVPTVAAVGNPVPINVTVRNEGQFSENVTLTVYYMMTSTPIPILEKMNETNFILTQHLEYKIVQVTWNTTILDQGFYKINATATVDIDDIPDDNISIKSVTLNPPSHDVAAVALSANPSTVLVGESITINVTVRNDGTFNEALVQVIVTYDTGSIGDQSISLLIGENKTLTFTWTTEGITPRDDYLVKAEAILDGEATPTNNFKFVSVAVQALPPGHIAGSVKDTSTGDPIVGANVTTNGYFDITDAGGQFNIINIPVGTYNVTASAAGYEASTKINIAVATGLTTNLDFTLTLIPTTGHINGIVKDASTGNPVAAANVTADGHYVLTGVDGSYDIELQPGTYTVTVSADGYEESSRTGIAVIAGESTPVNFSLTPIQPTNMLPYLALAAMAIVAVACIAIYFLKIRK
jgi:Carboxypeptidase regulatory-like domain/CARDB